MQLSLQSLFHRHSKSCKKCCVFTPPTPFDRKAGFAIAIMPSISLEDFIFERADECPAFAKLARSN